MPEWIISSSAPALWKRQGNSGGNLNYGNIAAYNNGMFCYILPSVGRLNQRFLR